jgi:hypothetical protein
MCNYIDHWHRLDSIISQITYKPNFTLRLLPANA